MKKLRDPEKQRKYAMIAYALGAVLFLALVIVAAWLFNKTLTDLGFLAVHMSEGVQEAKNLTFPGNETKMAMEVSLFAALAPMMYGILAFLLFMIVWCAGWVGKMLYSFNCSWKRKPTHEDLWKYLEDLYVQAEKKKR